jgi:Uma2 family endonuclease
MPAAIPPDRESMLSERFVLHDVPWRIYVALRDGLGETSHVRLTYFEGTLELMRPSLLHEGAKTIIARLVEAWAVERRIDLRGFGSTTFRREAKARGLEPDECYKVGALGEDDVPDIAIEVIVGNPLVDKLAVYAGLGVPEVWTWHADDSRLVAQRLVGGRYEPRDRSEILPGLDLAVLARFVRPGESQTELVIGYQAELRAVAPRTRS